MCFELKFVFLCEKNAQHLKNDAYFAWRFACCCCFQKAARFLLGEKIRVVISFVSPLYRQDILGLWKKEIQRVSKNKSNSLSGRKGSSHAGNGKTLRAKQNRADVQIFRGDKKNRAISKTSKRVL